MASSVRPSGPGPAPGLPGTSGSSRRSIRLGSPSKGGAQPKQEKHVKVEFRFSSILRH